MTADVAPSSAARSLLFAGALISADVEREPGATPHRVQIHGAGLLAELALALPDGETLSRALE